MDESYTRTGLAVVQEGVVIWLGALEFGTKPLSKRRKRAFLAEAVRALLTKFPAIEAIIMERARTHKLFDVAIALSELVAAVIDAVPEIDDVPICKVYSIDTRHARSATIGKPAAPKRDIVIWVRELILAQPTHDLKRYNDLKQLKEDEAEAVVFGLAALKAGAKLKLEL